MPHECLFCRIAHGEIPVELVYENDMVVAFRDINPQAPTHILIVPKQHIPDVLHLPEADGKLIEAVFTAAGELARREGIAESGFRVVVNSGPDAGQTVAHLHFHLLGGRVMGWPPG